MKIKIAELPQIFTANESLTKRWYVFYSFRNPETGKMERFRVYESINTQKTIKSRYKEAERIKTNIVDKFRSGWSPFNDANIIYSDSIQGKIYEDVRKCNTTWEKVLTQYLSEIKPAIRYGTYTTYKSKFGIFCKWLETQNFAKNDISITDDILIKKFYDYLFNTRKVGNKMVNHYTRLFKKVCNDLIIQGILFKNYFEKMPKYTQITVTPQILPDNILIDIKDYFIKNDVQMWTICQFIFYCFVRPIELRYLQVKYIDFVNGWLTVPANIAKNKKTQKVIIPSHFVEYLKLMNYHTTNKEFYIFSKSGSPDHVPLCKNYMFNHFHMMRKKLNLSKDFKFYSMKHTGGLKLYKSGADPIEIKNQFRHHSLDQLMQYLKALEGSESSHIRYNGFKL